MKCMFGATNIVQKSDKSNYAYSAYERAFDVSVSKSFGNDFAGNLVIVNVDISSLFLLIITRMVFQC